MRILLEDCEEEIVGEMDLLKRLDGALTGIAWSGKLLSSVKRNVEDAFCVVKLSGMGSAVLTLPAIRSLAKKKKVVAAVWKKRAGQVYELCPYVHKVIYLSELSWLNARFPVAFDFELFSGFSAWLTGFLGGESVGFATVGRDRAFTQPIPFDPLKHQAENYMKLVGSYEKPIFPDPDLLRIPKEAERRVQELLNDIKRPIVAIHPSTEHESKQRRWPGFPALARKLVKKGFSVVIVGKGLDASELSAKILGEEPRAIDFTDKLSFPELCAFLKEADVFVSNDTGPMHLSALFNPCTIGLFGPSDPRSTGPLAGVVVQGRCSLSPCHREYLREFSKCREPVCMRSISVRKVVELVEILVED